MCIVESKNETRLFLKVVHQLTEKCKQMQSEVKKSAKLKVEHKELLDRHSAICTELDALRLDS